MSNYNEKVSTNVFDSGPAALNYGVPQGSILGPLISLSYKLP